MPSGCIIVDDTSGRGHFWPACSSCNSQEASAHGVGRKAWLKKCKLDIFLLSADVETANLLDSGRLCQPQQLTNPSNLESPWKRSALHEVDTSADLRSINLFSNGGSELASLRRGQRQSERGESGARVCYCWIVRQLHLGRCSE